MTWPTSSDYQEAVQNPGSCFADPELRSSQVELNQILLPRPRAGAFATVYKLVGFNKAWAVRCFNREVADQQKRYEAISEHLQRVRLPYTVDFSYLPEGVRVGKRWLPIVKMEWVNGVPLSTFIENNLRNPETLLRFAQDWVQMLNALRTAGIGHGDLQDGNVLVVGSQIKLVDYDGMYVPALAGSLSNETGQPNYQHPERSAQDFGPFIDNFSGWVIFASILAICRDPGLWTKFRGGDQCLLFHRADFERPETSEVFATLRRSNDSQITAMSSLLESFLFRSVAQIPSVDPSVFAQFSSLPSVQANQVPAWLSDHVALPAPNAMRERPSEASTAPNSATWVYDFVMPVTVSAIFTKSMLMERLSGLTLTVAASVSILLGNIWLSLIVCVLCSIIWVLFLRRRYRFLPTTEQYKACMKQARELRLSLAVPEAELAEALNRQTTERLSGEKELAKLNSDFSGLAAEEKARSHKLSVDVNSAIDPIRQKLLSIGRDESSERAAIQRTLGSRVNDLRTKLNSLSRDETSEIAGTLVNKQKISLHTFLRQQSIRTATIPGIGTGFKEKLNRAGVMTAADVTLYRAKAIQGIGDARAKSLLQWRTDLEKRHRLPAALSPDELKAIHSRFLQQKQQLTSALECADRDLDKAIRDLNTKFKGLRSPHEIKIELEEARLRVESTTLQAEIAQRRTTITSAMQKRQLDIDSKSKHTNVQIREIRERMLKLQWQKGAADKELGCYQSVSFARFLRKVAFGT